MLKLLRGVYHAAGRTPCLNAGSGKRYLSIEVTDEALQSMRVAISASNFPADRTPKNCTPAASLEGRAHAMLHILAKDSKRLPFASSLLRDMTTATSIDRENPYFPAAVAVVIEACLRDGKLTEAFEHFNASREVRLDNPIYESLIASICDQADDEKQNGMTTSEDFAQWPVPQYITNLVAVVEVLDSHQIVLNWEATTRSICTLVINGRAASALSLWTGRCRDSSRPPSYLTTSPGTQRETTACSSSSDYSGDNDERDKVMAGVAWADAAVKAVVDDSAVSPEYICDIMNATSDRIDMLKGGLKVEDEVPIVDEASHSMDMFKSLSPESLSRSSPEFLSSAEDAALQRLQCDASSILARMQEHCNEWELDGLFAYVEDPDNFFGDFDEDEEDAIASHIDDLIDPVEFERIIGACGDDNGEDEEEQDGDWDKDENGFEKVEEEGEESSEGEESPDTRALGPRKESDTKARDK